MSRNKKDLQGLKESYIPFGEPASFQLEEELPKEPGGDGWILLACITTLVVLLVYKVYKPS